MNHVLSMFGCGFDGMTLQKAGQSHMAKMLGQAAVTQSLWRSGFRGFLDPAYCTQHVVTSTTRLPRSWSFARPCGPLASRTKARATKPQNPRSLRALGYAAGAEGRGWRRRARCRAFDLGGGRHHLRRSHPDCVCPAIAITCQKHVRQARRAVTCGVPAHRGRLGPANQ